MAALNLYIDTSSRTLLSNQTGGPSKTSASIPFFYPDVINLNVYLLAPIANAPLGTSQYQSVPTTGLQLLLYINGGTENSPNLTQVVAWQTDPTNTFFEGLLFLNTAAIKQALGNSKNFNATLMIGYIQNGQTTTLIATQITIQAGLNNNALVNPPGLVPLSLQAALAMFVQINGPAGQGFVLQSKNGKKIYVQAIDNPDGTASVLEAPMN